MLQKATPMTTQLERFNDSCAPLDFRKESWWEMGRAAAKAGAMRLNGWPAENMAKVMSELFFAHANGPSADPKSHKEWMLQNGMEIAHCAAQCAHFEVSGRQIFDFSKDVTELFKNTDVNDCTLQNLHLPYPSQYIRFGPQQDTWTDMGGIRECFDGAFISLIEMKGDDGSPLNKGRETHRINFVLTTIREDGSRPNLPHFSGEVAAEDMGLSAFDALHNAISQSIEVSKIAATEMPSDGGRNQAREEGLKNMLARVTPLLVNAMFYLENPPVEPTPRPSPGTPKEWVEDWERLPQGKQNALRKKIASQGHTIVHLVTSGRNSKDCQADQPTEDARRSAHWRRGHWREQAHGPALSLRKRILIRPMMINAKGMDPVDVPGHVYLPDPSQESLERARSAQAAINQMTSIQRKTP
jgi:hypothetical protein